MLAFKVGLLVVRGKVEFQDKECSGIRWQYAAGNLPGSAPEIVQPVVHV